MTEILRFEVKLVVALITFWFLAILSAACNSSNQPTPAVSSTIVQTSTISTSYTPQAIFTYTITPTPTFLPTSTSTPSPTSTPTPTPSPTLLGGGSGKVILDLNKASYSSIFPDLQGENNIFVMNIDGTELLPITDNIIFHENSSVVKILDASPDGSKVIIGSFIPPPLSPNNLAPVHYGELFVVDINGKGLIRIANNFVEQFYVSDLHGAYWTSDGTKIVYVARVSEISSELAIFIVNPDGSGAIRLTGSDLYPTRLIPTSDTSVIYFETACTSNSMSSEPVFCGYQKIGIDSQGLEWVLDSPHSPYQIEAVARKNNRIVLTTKNKGRSFVTDFNLTNPIEIDMILCSRCAFLSPNGSKFLQLELLELGGRNSLWKVNMWSLPAGVVSELQQVNGNDIYFGRPEWSPDGRLLWFGIHILNVETLEVSSLSLPISLPDFVDTLWLP